MRTDLTLLLAAVIALGLAGCGASGQGGQEANAPEYVFTYAENQAEDYPTAQGAVRFAQLVYERTDGKIEIQVNAGGSLGDERGIIKQMRFGGIDFARTSLSSLADFIPKLNVLQMPYLYTDANHMWEILEGDIGDDFLNSFEGSGLVALSWYDAGARNFYSTKKPVECLEDMKGMKIRVQESEVMQRMVRALGGIPVPLPYDAVYSALETGEIDGAENNWPSYDSEGHYQVASYYTVDEHTRVPELQLVSEVTWNKLSDEYKKIIKECAQESAIYERQLWEKRTRESESRVRDNGCHVVELSPEEKARVQEAMIPIYGEFCRDYMDIIEAIMEAGR